MTTDSLRAKTATIVMHRGTRVTGTITTRMENQFRARWSYGATIRIGDHHPQQEVLTDENGVYHFPPLPNGAMTVTVVAQDGCLNCERSRSSPACRQLISN